jgi:hypothetical protein
MGADLDCGLLQGTGNSDTTGVTGSWRSGMNPSGGSQARDSTLWRGWMVDYTDDGNCLPRLQVPSTLGSAGASDSLKWDTSEDRRPMMEARLGWSSTSGITGESKFKGQLFGGMVMAGQRDGESTITFDGHTFMAITDLCNTDVSGNVATLFVAVD